MRVLAAHGSGGALTQTLIGELFLRHFTSPKLQRLEDGAVLDLAAGAYVMSTDSFVVSPLFFPGGDIGTLAVAGTVNDLAAMGAMPLYLSVGFILEAGLELALLERVVVSMADSAQSLGIEIVTGDTKVVEGPRSGEPGLFVNTTGLGRRVRAVAGREAIVVGDKLLISGGLAEHGFAVLAARLGQKDGPQSDCAPLWPLVRDVLHEVPVKFMRDPTRGGLAAVCNELATGSPFGLRLDEARLPLSPKVAALSELLGVSPLEAASEGRMLFVVAAEAAPEALRVLRMHPLGEGAAEIGEIVEGPAGKVLMANAYGVQRLLPMPLGEQLPRIC